MNRHSNTIHSFVRHLFLHQNNMQYIVGSIAALGLIAGAAAAPAPQNDISVANDAKATNTLTTTYTKTKVSFFE